MPVTCAPVWQAKKSPRRQLSQERQCQACQPTPTRWPACHRPGTSLPTALITPTTSCPGTRGKVMPGQWCYGWCYGLAGITVCSAGEWSPAWRASSKASDSGPPRAQVGWFSWAALREFDVQPNGYEPRSLFLALLRDRDLFGVAGVQDHREEAGPG